MATAGAYGTTPASSRGTRLGSGEVAGMREEHFLNTYRNASTPPPPDVPALLASFTLAADPVLAQAAELARVITHAHQGAATQLI